MRKLLSLAAVACIAPQLGAQSVFDSELRFAPQFMQYQIHSPNNETISEFAVPVFVSVPFGPSFTFDVGTSYTRARVTSGSALSEISGITDTQLRGNLTLGNDFLVITGGVNLPTGQSSVTLDQLTAAGRIGSDFLAFPISNLGTGAAFTGGIAIARPIHDWNIGFGGSARVSQSYSPFNVPGQTLRFQPGSEYRGRVGVDHSLGSGRFSLGVTYSAFADDDAGGSVYNTGNRIITQSVVTSLIGETDVVLAGYDIFRQNGKYASGDVSGHENILNGYLGLGIHALGTVIEPSIEARNWIQEIPAVGALASRSQNSYLGTFGLRTRLHVGQLTFYPSAAYTLGSLATVNATNVPVHADLDGFRVQLAVRLAP